jgi:hypothetical protein
MMTSSSQVIKNVRFVSEEMVHMDWLYLDDLVEVSGRTNVVIAAYTTAQARLKLSKRTFLMTWLLLVIISKYSDGSAMYVDCVKLDRDQIFPKS